MSATMQLETPKVYNFGTIVDYTGYLAFTYIVSAIMIQPFRIAVALWLSQHRTTDSFLWA